MAGRITRCLPIGIAERFVNLVTRKEKFFSVDQIYDLFTKKVCSRLMLELPGRGCAWYKKSGGCKMCGFSRRLEEINAKWKFSSGDLVGVYRMAETLSRPHRPEWLYIYNGGSFLNIDEVPLKTQLGIGLEVRRHPTISGLFIESRPEFIQAESIRPLQLALGSKSLEVGIGLEAVSDVVRENYIHKGFSRNDYQQAVRILKSLGVFVLTYVLLKPPRLTESEAIDEAIKTIIYAFTTGSDEVSLSCTFVQEGTCVAEDYAKGKFRPPWLWSILEVIIRTAHLGPVRIGSFEDSPPPIAIPHNCNRCDPIIRKRIGQYNLTHYIDIFNVSCECKEIWRQEF